MERSESTLRWLKQHVFEYVFTLDSNRWEQWWAAWAVVLFELGVVHYFYLHPTHPILHHYALLQHYFDIRGQLMPHLTPFFTPTPSLALLSLYPRIGLLAFIAKVIGPNKIVVTVLQLAIFIHPLLAVKVVI